MAMKAQIGMGLIDSYVGGSSSESLDCGKNCKLNITADPPAKNFWSRMVYDTQMRSMLQTDQQFPSKGSHSEGIQKNAEEIS